MPDMAIEQDLHREALHWFSTHKGRDGVFDRNRR